MSFKKGFAKQDAELEDILAKQRVSVAKVRAILDKLEEGKPVSVQDAQELTRSAQVLLARARRYQHINQRFDFIGG